MTPKRLLYLFLILLIFSWFGGIAFLARNFSLLDEYNLAGVMGIALIFMPLIIAGVWSEVPEYPTWHEAWQLVLKFWVVLAAIYLGFCGGLWVILIALKAIWPVWLPIWLELPVYIIIMSWYVAGLIKGYIWLAKHINEW